MKILLVQSSLGDYKLTVVFPLGLAYLASALDVHEVELVDLNVSSNTERTLSQKISEFQPDIIGISMRNSDDQNRKNFRNFYRDQFQPEVKLLRNLAGPGVPIIVGGAAFSIFSEIVMEENKEIDFGIYLEGEESFPELLNNLSTPWEVKGVFYRNSTDEVKFTGARPLLDFKRVKTPRRDLLDLTLYTPMEGVGIQTNRGCVNECSYCVYPFLGGSKLRLRSVESVVDEIQLLVEEYAMNSFFFADSSFGLAKKYALQIFDEIESRNLDVSWGAYIDMGVDESFLLRAQKAGCRWFVFSPDGYSDEALRGLKKGFTSRHVREHIKMLFHHPILSNEEVLYSFMLNPPAESFIGLCRTVFMIYRYKILRKLKGKKKFNIVFGWIRIEPQTSIHDIAKEQGDLEGELSLLPKKSEPFEHIFYRHPFLFPSDTLFLWVERIIPKITGFFKRSNT